MSIGPTVLYEDNQAALCMARNAQYHGRAKHIDLRHHFVREKVSERAIDLKYCHTDCIIADILTNGLPSVTFEKLQHAPAHLLNK